MEDSRDGDCRVAPEKKTILADYNLINILII
jgi:hypothetical protein